MSSYVFSIGLLSDLELEKYLRLPLCLKDSVFCLEVLQSFMRAYFLLLDPIVYNNGDLFRNSSLIQTTLRLLPIVTSA